MNRIVHFEIHAKDMDAAQKFYGDVFGWKFQVFGPEMGNYRTIATDADMPQEAKDAPVMSPLGMQWVGINGGITPRRGDAPKGGEPVNAFVCVIGVDNIDLYIEKVKTAGGTIAVDKMKVPGVGDLAYAKDLEGNIFGMLQPDMTMEKK